MTFIIENGDLIQARKATEQDIVAVEFTVTGQTAGKCEGCTLGPLDPADGWTFELVRKGDPNLPTVISDLAAWTAQRQTEPVRIIGPIDGIWQTPTGARVYPSEVLAWVPWADYVPEGVE